MYVDYKSVHEKYDCGNVAIFTDQYSRWLREPEWSEAGASGSAQ